MPPVDATLRVYASREVRQVVTCRSADSDIMAGPKTERQVQSVRILALCLDRSQGGQPLAPMPGQAVASLRDSLLCLSSPGAWNSLARWGRPGQRHEGATGLRRSSFELSFPALSVLSASLWFITRARRGAMAGVKLIVLVKQLPP